jgi:hypothetical protein
MEKTSWIALGAVALVVFAVAAANFHDVVRYVKIHRM